MKKGKKALCILLAGALLFPSAGTAYAKEKASQETMESVDVAELDIDPVGAAGEETDPANFKTSGTDDNLVIEKYNGSASVVDIGLVFEGKTVTSIKAGAFCEKSSLTKVVIPASVVTIGGANTWRSAAFANCSSLRTVEIKEGSALTSIGGYAFYGCESLTSMELPADVAVIDERAFSGCNKLKTVTFAGDSTLESIGEYAFYNCTALASFAIPETVEDIGRNAFDRCSSLTSVTIPAGITAINDRTFFRCSKLRTVTFAENSTLESIGEYAFNDCSSLTAVEFPASLATIGDQAFDSCSVLARVTFPEQSTLTSIGAYAFWHCNALSSVAFPESLLSVGNEAFASCSQLSELSFQNPNTTLNKIFGNSVNKNVVIKGEPGGSVAQFAEDNNIRFNRFLKSLSLKTLPVKTEYFYGETFNAAGMELSAEYESDTEPKTEVLNAATIENTAVITGFNSQNAGTQTVTVSYGGKSVRFDVSVYYNMEKVSISANGSGYNKSYPYTGYPVEPEFSLRSSESGVTLAAGSDYELSLAENHTDVGKVTAKFNGKGLYKGEQSYEYEITPRSMSDNDISVTVSDMGYTGEQLRPVPVVSYAGVALTAGKDYLVTYGTNVEVGTGRVNIEGQGNFSGSVSRSFQITPKDIKELTIKDIADQYYTGYEIRPVVRVEIDAYTPLTLNVDYTVKYRNNTKVGTGYVLIEGRGRYTGSVEKSFKIIKSTQGGGSQKGATYTVGAYKYTVTGASEVAFAGLKSDNTKKVTINATVKIAGKTMKVTSVADSALYGKNKVTKVVIGKNVKKIGSSAFAYCSKLKTIQVKSTKLTKVGKNALSGIKVKAKIKVPAKKLSKYKKVFKNKGQSKSVKITK